MRLPHLVLLLFCFIVFDVIFSSSSLMPPALHSDEVLANSGEGLLLLHALLLRAFTNLILLLGRPVALPALLGPVLQSLLGAQHHLNCVLEATRTVALLSTEAAYRGVVADEQVLQRLTDLLTLAPDVLMALARPGNAEDRGAAPMPYAPLPAAGARPPVERWVFQAPPPPEPAAAPPSNRLRDALGAAQSPEARDVIHIDMPGPAPAADRAPDPPGSPAPAPAREPAAGVTPVVFWGELLKYVLVALANVCVPDGLEERAVRAGAQGRVVALLRQVKELTEHSAQASARYAQKFENVYEGWEPSSSSPRRARLQPCDSNLVKWLGMALSIARLDRHPPLCISQSLCHRTLIFRGFWGISWGKFRFSVWHRNFFCALWGTSCSLCILSGGEVSHV